VSLSPICGAESTIVHALLGRPILGAGALICAAVIGGTLSMTGTPDQFGGCGEVGGELHRVVDLADTTPVAYCAVSEQPPVAVSK
jgi:hypothetical protein